MLGGPTPLWVSSYNQLSLVQSSRSIQRMQTLPWPKQVFFVFFREDQFLASQTKKLRKRMCLVDQLPCGSLLTPAISCTTFKDPFSACRQSYGQNMERKKLTLVEPTHLRASWKGPSTALHTNCLQLTLFQGICSLKAIPFELSSRNIFYSKVQYS